MRLGEASIFSLGYPRMHPQHSSSRRGKAGGKSNPCACEGRDEGGDIPAAWEGTAAGGQAILEITDIAM